jgi:sulfate adenylyltransferase subunit 1
MQTVTESNIEEKSADHRGGALRFITAGSVDDGKSTLIGRLLYDSKAIFADQLDALARAKHKRVAGASIDLAQLTDGLEAEREQGITIDVAYRYFATPKRKFIIADTPGHEQYTRNMVTGASSADAAVILIDATRVQDGKLLPQTRRHSALAALLGVEHLVVAVNKMDLVGYSQEKFEEIRRAYIELAAGLKRDHVHFVPVSALAGDNVVERTATMPWYEGPALLALLESLPVERNSGAGDLRFPVQLVLRSDGHKAEDFRGYAGRVESGTVRKGDAVTVLPAQIEARVAAIRVLEGEREQAHAGESVTLVLDRDIDVSRGDTIVLAASQARVARRFTADLCWLDTEPFAPQRKYLLKHTTRTVPAKVAEIESRLDIHTLAQVAGGGVLNMNDIARVSLNLAQPIVCDSFDTSAATGAFILIDTASNQTAAAGMIRAIEA